jgi:hypothetical protein
MRRETQRKNSVTVYVVRDEEQPVGRLLIEELPEQRHGAAGPTAPISGSLRFAGAPGGKSCSAPRLQQSIRFSLSQYRRSIYATSGIPSQRTQ